MYTVNMIHLAVLWVSLYVYLMAVVCHCTLQAGYVDMYFTMFVVVHSPPLSFSICLFYSRTASIMCTHEYTSYSTSVSGHASRICSAQGLKSG